MHGFYNRLLRVDLSAKTWAAEPIADEVLALYLGGKGLASQLLLENVPVGVDPLAPENPLILALGPASGSVLAPASRYGLYAKAPQTGIFTESYSGGHTAPKIKATGYDAIIIQGAAETPTFLEISDQGVVFHDATPYWGTDAIEAEDALEKAVGVRGAKAIVIGPAGENLVAFACVANDHGRQAGRTGLGALMGSKRLKGMVFHGQSQCKWYDADAVAALDKELRERGKSDGGAKAYRNLGTPMVVAIANKVGSFPSYYWSAGTVPHWPEISAEKMVERYKPRSTACYRCFFACGKMCTVPDGPHKGLTVEGPEYETLFSFGGLCAIDDLDEIVYLNDLCDRLGLDTITAGNVAGFAIEASRRGALDLKLDYGDSAGVAELIQLIARREGIGELLSQGVRAASRELGLEDLAIHVKGLEPSGYDPRALKGMGLAFAIASRGACHLRATVYKAEFAGWTDRTVPDDKAEFVLDFEDRHTVYDTLIFCRFYRDMLGWDHLPPIIHALTGLDLDKAGLQALSARIANAIRQFNLREGMTAADDRLPERFFREPLTNSGESLTHAQFDQMLGEYYERRGWQA